MKKFRIPFFILLTALCFVTFASCVSTPKETEKKNETDEFITENEDEPQGKVIREPKALTVQNTSSEKEAEFKKTLEQIELELVQVPKKTVYAGSAFSSPYVISVTNKNEPVKNFNITISWPISRNNDTIIYSTAQMETDESGRISFLPGIPSIAVNDKITFYPTPVTSSQSIVKAAFDLAITSPYQVKSKYIRYPGGVLFVYDYNEKGRATTNDFALLQNLRNQGVNAGNAPLSDSSYLDRSPQEIYKACIDITQGEIKKSANFLVIGSFKWASPPEETSEGIKVTLKAEITCLDMQDGSVKYKTTITESTTDKTKSNAESKCRTSLAAKISESIIYGM